MGGGGGGGGGVGVTCVEWPERSHTHMRRALNHAVKHKPCLERERHSPSPGC